MKYGEPPVPRFGRYPTRPPRPRAPWAWVGALALLGSLGAGLLSAAMVLWRYVDVDSVLEAATLLPPTRVAEVAAEVPLPEPTAALPWVGHLYVSSATARFFPNRLYYAALAKRWSQMLRETGAEVLQISGAEALAALPAGSALIMPATVCLGDDERRALQEFVGRGGHLVASWALGARDEACEWRGYEFLKELYAADGVGTLKSQPPTFVAVPRSSVLAAGLPPGIRIELKNEPWIALRSEATGAFWSDWALNPRAGPGGGAAGAATAAYSRAGGRMVWIGFRLDHAARERDQRVIDHFVTSALHWVAGHVVADVGPWPAGHRAALTITQDVEKGFRNSRILARRFTEIDAPITFFVVSKLAREHPDIATELLAAGEVGSHSVDHRQVAGRLWGNQLAALRQARNDLRDWTGEQPRGLRPPRELYDQFTLEAWRRFGGTYIAGSTAARSAVPEIFDVPSGQIVVLPRVVDDDYAVAISQRKTSTAALREAFVAALEKIRSLGGLDLVTTHTQLIDSERRAEAVVAVVAAARRAQDVWIADTETIADWWLRRSQLELRVQGRTDGGAVLTVRNEGRGVVEGVWLDVFLPDVGESYAAPELADSVLESYYAAWGLRIALPNLEPAQSLNVVLPRRTIERVSAPTASAASLR